MPNQPGHSPDRGRAPGLVRPLRAPLDGQPQCGRTQCLPDRELLRSAARYAGRAHDLPTAVG
jgi:hypothetical protein